MIATSITKYRFKTLWTHVDDDYAVLHFYKSPELAEAYETKDDTGFFMFIADHDDWIFAETQLDEVLFDSADEALYYLVSYGCIVDSNDDTGDVHEYIQNAKVFHVDDDDRAFYLTTNSSRILVELVDEIFYTTSFSLDMY